MSILSVFNTDDFNALNLQQKVAFYAGHKGNSIQIIGSGGVGKSFLTKALVRHVPDLVVLGSTGTAAVNIGGQTVDSFFGFGRHFFSPEEGESMHPATFQTLKKTNRILIDEFGALRRDKLQLMDIRLRAAKRNNLPFGGVQLIGVGDFCQIKPVLPSNTEESRAFAVHYGREDVYPFLMPGFEELGLEPYLLSQNIRLSDSYEQHILKHVRLGLDVKEAVARINGLVRPSPDDDTITLCALKRVAGRYNSVKYSKIELSEKVYFSDQEGEVDFNPAPHEIRLKEGVRVVLTINNPGSGFYNGDLGTVVALEDEGVHVALDRGAQVFVSPYTWDFLQQKTGEDGSVTRARVGGYTQLPILLAYGITIHRSQGMTLPSAHIDLTGGFFAEGMCYVALSRAVSLKNVSLSRRLTARDVFYSQQAIDMTKKLSLQAIQSFAQREQEMLRGISSL